MVIKHVNGNFVLHVSDGLYCMESAPQTRFVITMLARHATMSEHASLVVIGGQLSIKS